MWFTEGGLEKGARGEQAVSGGLHTADARGFPPNAMPPEVHVQRRLLQVVCHGHRNGSSLGLGYPSLGNEGEASFHDEQGVCTFSLPGYSPLILGTASMMPRKQGLTGEEASGRRSW